MTTKRKFTAYLQEVRNVLTVREVGYVCGVSDATVKRWENGHRPLNPEHAFRQLERFMQHLPDHDKVSKIKQLLNVAVHDISADESYFCIKTNKCTGNDLKALQELFQTEDVYVEPHAEYGFYDDSIDEHIYIYCKREVW